MEEQASDAERLQVIEGEIGGLGSEADRLRAKLGVATDTPDHAHKVLQSVTEHAIVTTDLEGRITGWNPGAVNNLVWSEGKALGRDAGALFFTPEDRALDRPKYETAIARTIGHANDERWHLRKDGRFYAQGQMTPLLDSRSIHIGSVKVLRDRTGQRLAEDAAQVAVDELQRITDSLPILIAVVGRDQRYQFANRYHETWFGVARDRIVSRHMREVLGEEAYRDRLAQIERALAGTPVNFDSYLPDKGGEKRDCHIQHIPRRAADGSVDGFYVQVVDITERKRAAEHLRQADATVHSTACANWTAPTAGSRRTAGSSRMRPDGRSASPACCC